MKADDKASYSVVYRTRCFCLCMKTDDKASYSVVYRTRLLLFSLISVTCKV